MAELQQNRYDKLIRRVGGIIGPGSMVSESISELFPMIDVENLPAELYALMGTRIAFGASQVQAGGGLTPQIQIFNPVDSATIITVTRMIWSSDIDNGLTWDINSVPFTTLTTRGSLRDTRLVETAPNLSVGEIRVQSSAVPVPASGVSIYLARTTVDIRDENGLAVLSPGFGFNTGAAGVASLLNVTYYWRERTLESSEVNL